MLRGKYKEHALYAYKTGNKEINLLHCPVLISFTKYVLKIGYQKRINAPAVIQQCFNNRFNDNIKILLYQKIIACMTVPVW